MVSWGVKLFGITLASTGIAGGGFYIYIQNSPENLSVVYKWDGFSVLSAEADFRAVFFDQKSLIVSSKEIPDINHETTLDQAWERVKHWCEQKSALPIEERKQEYYSAFCTASGIISTKGFLTKTTTKKEWIEDQDTNKQEESYKIMVLVYQDDTRFLEWTGIDKWGGQENHKTLKIKCEEALRTEHKKNTMKIGENANWWCRPLPYNTIEGKIKDSNKSWKKRTNWTKIHETWKYTKDIFEQVKPASSSYPQDSDYQTWCEKTLNTNLTVTNAYSNLYPWAKKVCGEE